MEDPDTYSAHHQKFCYRSKKEKRHRAYLEKKVDKMLSNEDQRADWERIGLQELYECSAQQINQRERESDITVPGSRRLLKALEQRLNLTSNFSKSNCQQIGHGVHRHQLNDTGPLSILCLPPFLALMCLKLVFLLLLATVAV